ncbi:7544_t:CDS:2 [Ambispora gerdemannii]|uniref:7544_t:CDS:1 n=1 Tax=Ambispora gerdemannii TaxID=144530 RepID=A0A9N9GB98_9GLOM|nr:7544_t:CDS:2 [Ambispora gerdemannii]
MKQSLRSDVIQVAIDRRDFISRKRFQRKVRGTNGHFDNWTLGNEIIDSTIRNAQMQLPLPQWLIESRTLARSSTPNGFAVEYIMKNLMIGNIGSHQMEIELTTGANVNYRLRDYFTFNV